MFWSMYTSHLKPGTDLGETSGRCSVGRASAYGTHAIPTELMATILGDLTLANLTHKPPEYRQHIKCPPGTSHLDLQADFENLLSL